MDKEMWTIKKASARFYEENKDLFSLRADEPMHCHTSFRVGGAADLYAAPQSLKEMQDLLSKAYSANIPVTVLGGGTNMLVRDEGIGGLVVSTLGLNQGLCIEAVNTREYFLTAPAGMALSKAARAAMKNSLEGLVFAAGIPGTVGGAVMMNAGTGNCSMSDILHHVDVMHPKGRIETIPRKDIGFSIRKTDFTGIDCGKNNLSIIVRAAFLLKKGEKQRLETQWQTFLTRRKRTQPGFFPSAGCFFKNLPDGRAAGELIDRAGLKGRRIGDAVVSDVHANFIINMGNASSEDILKLKETVIETVFQLFSVKLETEVKIEGRQPGTTQ
ncbi:MAG: UDP-N-acetylmuramate dehydrogenase [Desulfobacteraceae bacterium]